MIKQKLVSKYEYDPDKQKSVKVKELNFVTTCRRSYPVKYWNIDNLKNEHKKCIVCKILEGRSKATKLNDYQVIELFKIGHNKIFRHKVESRNFEFNDHVLRHNGSIEAIRRKRDNKIIKNSQHIAYSGSMFGSHVSCPTLKDSIPLPLDTISREIFKQEFRDDIIEIVEYLDIIQADRQNYWYIGDKGIIFKALKKYCWFKSDENHEYLIILPKEVSNYKDANQCLKPSLMQDMKENIDYKRIGDFYFIDTKEQFKQYDKFQRQKCDLYHSVKYYPEKYKDQYPQLQELMINEFPEKFKNDLDIRDQMVLDLLTTQKTEDFIYLKQDLSSQIITREKINKIVAFIKQNFKEVRNGDLQRYDIYDSNHIADNSFYDSVQFVKGYVYHKNKDHSRRKFDSWHMVLKNESVESWQVDPTRAPKGD
jgi:hypothetical protein